MAAAHDLPPVTPAAWLDRERGGDRPFTRPLPESSRKPWTCKARWFFRLQRDLQRADVAALRRPRPENLPLHVHGPDVASTSSISESCRFASISLPVSSHENERTCETLPLNDRIVPLAATFRLAMS